MGTNGDILNIYVDLIPDDEFERRKLELEKADAVCSELFGSIS